MYLSLFTSYNSWQSTTWQKIPTLKSEKNDLKKWLGTRVMFELSFTSKILRLIITNNNSIDEPNGL